MKLFTLVKVAYMMLIVTLLLMLWTPVAWMYELPVRYPSCFFNPLCTCSKVMPDLGIVACNNVPMPRLPQPINSSKVFMLQLQNNGLRFLQSQYLMNTGLYKLQIKHNLLPDIPDEAFLGLERSLWELDLSYNELANIPSKSFRRLQKLRLLELTGNRISHIVLESWRGLENSLQILRLGRNTIEKLPADAFAGLTYLEILDLRENNLKNIDPAVFRDGMAHLTYLYLNGNQLVHLPYAQLSPLKRMKVLDISYNRISELLYFQQEQELQGVRISLDVLQLAYNQIEKLSPNDFQHFLKVNHTYLNGNPLTVIEEGAFRNSRIRELYLSDCDLLEINPATFAGLESSLEVLDISGNNITTLTDTLFQHFDILRVFTLRENPIKKFLAAEIFKGFQYSLYNLDLSGKQNGIVSLQDLRQMRNLRFLSLSRMPQDALSANDFLEFGMDIKELRITHSVINTIKSHAFMHLRGIKHLDFSENTILTIEDDAFAEVGHSLLTLRLSHGLSSKISEMPSRSLKSLKCLQYLDFSNNKIRSLPSTSFYFLEKIKRIQLQDNEINNIPKGIFQGHIHSSLEEIDFAFNQVKNIQTHTFVDLSAVVTINLEDNIIEKIDRRAFMNMYRLKYINLRANKIKDIADEAFQNLPDLEFLDLAYNDLNKFNFAFLDQVGTLSSFKVNVSHNAISRLWMNSSTFESSFATGGNVQSSITILDMSHNNISDITRYYFKPVEYSLTHLYLSNNQLTNITRGVFGNMPHLQWLDLSHNELFEMDFDCFKNTRNLQILSLSWNNIMDVPSKALRSLQKLRIVDLSHNRLRSLSDNMFIDANIESLDLSHNQFTRLPVKSMSLSSAVNLSNLDMSWNLLSGIHSTDMISRLRSLVWLDLSYNRLVRLEDGVFSELSYLTHLDLSHNKQLLLEIRGRTFYGLEDSLLYLSLSNISLLSIPELSLKRLQTLHLAYNELASVPTEMSNLTSLRYLDLSYNDLTMVPLITHTLPELKIFNLADNPITTITNTSFLGMADNLEELDIRGLSLSVFETGALCKATKLRKLHITAYTMKNFNLPNILQNNHGLGHLLIDVRNNTNLEREMRGKFPYKLYNIILTGRPLKTIHPTILSGIQNPHLHFEMYNTSVTIIARELFSNAQRVRNITIELRDNDIRTLHNPSSGYQPGVPGKQFLMKLRLAGHYLDCNCDIGWIEVWQRKHRQYQEDRCISYDEFRGTEHEDIDEFNCWDNGWDDDLRETFCRNKKNISLSKTLKLDIECGWGAASYTLLPNTFVFFFSLIVIVIVY